jgi:putative intracellular protease/amidase
VQKEYRSKEWYPAEEELPIQEAKVSDFAAVVIPGGYAPDPLRRDDKINQFVKDMFMACGYYIFVRGFWANCLSCKD